MIRSDSPEVPGTVRATNKPAYVIDKLCDIQEFLDAKEIKENLSEAVKETCRYFNAALKKYGYPEIKVDPRKVEENILEHVPSSDSQNSLRFFKKIVDLKVYRTAIYTAVGILAELDSQEDPETKERKVRDLLANATVVCVVQSGKSAIAQILERVGPALFALLGRGLGTFRTFIPSRIQLECQYTTEQNQMSMLLDNLVFSRGSVSKSVAKIRASTAFLAGAGMCIRASKGKHMRDAEHFLRQSEHLDYVVVILDESDHGSGVGSILAKMLECYFVSPKASMILLSATNYDGVLLQNKMAELRERGLTKKEWSTVVGWLDKGYYGFPFSCGLEMNKFKEYSYQPLNYFSMEEEFGLDTDKMFFPAFESKAVFNKWKRSHEFNSWSNYRSFVIDKLIGVIETVLLNPTYRDNKERNHQGLAVRLSTGIASAIKINHDVAEELNKVWLVKHPNEPLEFICHDSHTPLDETEPKQSTQFEMREVLRRKVRANQKFMLFLAGSGRRGDVFPPCCSNYLDFSNATFVNTEIQGLIGRGQGYNKYSRVYVTSKTKTSIDDWVAHKGMSSVKKLSLRLTTEQQNNAYRPLQFVECFLDDVLARLEQGDTNPHLHKIKKFFDFANTQLFGGESNQKIGSPENSWALLRELSSVIPDFEALPAVFAGSQWFGEAPQILRPYPAMFLTKWSHKEFQRQVKTGILRSLLDNARKIHCKQGCGFDTETLKYIPWRSDIRFCVPLHCTIGRRRYKETDDGRSSRRTRKQFRRGGADHKAADGDIERCQNCFEMDWENKKIVKLVLILSKPMKQLRFIPGTEVLSNNSMFADYTSANLAESK